MIKKLINKILSSEGHENINTPQNGEFTFELFLEELHIGTLQLLNGRWYFNYTEDFKNQNKILQLVDFPDKNKKYDTDSLWPFFRYRIPGLNQPQVKEIIKKESIDSTNEAELLKKFGKRTIFNPFQLKVSHPNL